MNAKRFNCILLLVLAVVANAWAQASFTVQVPSRVQQGDKFYIVARLKNASGRDLRMPDIDGCTLLYGPTTSQSHSTQIVNGNMTSTSSISYTYFYRADRVGTVNVGEATINADGKTLHSKPASFEVVAAKNNAAGGTARGQSQDVDIDDPTTQSADRSVSAKDVFVRIILSRPSVYEQEAVVCEIKLYTKYGISRFIPTKQPAFDNFLIEELDISNQLNVEEIYNGQRYLTALLKKCILYPQRSGKLTINSGNYDLTVIQYDNVNMGLFQVQQPREREIKITSNSATLDVKALPEPRPAGFNGAVGQFTAESHIIGSKYRSGEPISLVIDISGTGNIKYLTDPTVDFPSQFEVYTPTSNVNATAGRDNVSGKVSIDYTFVPESAGQFTIPATPFTYFNPATASYTTITLPSYTLDVAKGNSAGPAVEQQDIDIRNNDIRYISLTSDELGRPEIPVILRPWFWIMCAIIVILFVIAVIVTSRYLNASTDLASLRLAKANKQAQRRLKAANSAMASGNSATFYDEILRALWGYLSDKLAIPASQLSRSNIADELRKNGYSDEMTQQVIGLIDECEMAKYTPSQSQQQLGAIYTRCADIINHIERTKK